MPSLEERGRGGEEGAPLTSPPAGTTRAATWSRWVDRLEESRVAWTVLGVGMLVYAVLAMWLTRGTTLFIDEVNVFTGDQGLHPSALLAPLNGHFVLFQRLLFAVDFKLFGANFFVLRLVEVVGVVLVVGLFFELAKRRIGAAAALAPALLVLFLGSAWELNFVVSGIGNVYAVAAGLGAVLALERRDARSDVIACALLIVAVASFTLGVAFAVGAIVLILLQPGARRRLWVPLVPLALYVAWLVWVRAVYVPSHGEIQNFHAWNILLIPNFIADEASSVAGAVSGLNYNFQPQNFLSIFSTDSPYGPLLAAIAVAALAIRMRRGRRPPLLWASISILIAFWIALAVGFGVGRNPATVRYVYAGSIMALLVGVEAARGVRLSRGALLALYAITALALFANLARLREGANFYRFFATSLRAELTALELARDHVDPSLVPGSTTAGLAPVRAGPYLAAVDRAGSPAYSLGDLLRQPEARRHEADTVLVQALKIGITPVKAGEPVRNCRRLAGAGSSAVTLPVGPPGVRLSSATPGQVLLRRFASTSGVSVGSLPAGRPVDLRIPPDRSRRMWAISVTGAPVSLSECELPAAP